MWTWWRGGGTDWSKTWGFLALLALILLFASSEPASAEEARKKYVIGEQYTLHSKALGEERTFWVSLPASYDGSKVYRRYPVLYVLDGNLFFHPFTGVVKQLSEDATPLIPEMIVVGIDSLHRVRDSTPTRSLVGPDGKESKDWAESGGGEAFQRFMGEELIPYIDAHFSTSDYRVLAGYSLTGVPVIYNLFTRPAMFNAHLVLDGALWWDDRMPIRLAARALAERRFNHNELFILTTAQRFPAPYITVEPGGRELAALLERRPTRGLHVIHHEVTRETHHSLATIGLYEGLVSIFDGHMMTLDELYLTPAKIPARFERLSLRLGHSFAPPEGTIDFFGYNFMRYLPGQEMDKALFYFEMNTRNYPRSPNAWASLGEAYVEAHDCARAAAAFARSLALQPGFPKAQTGMEAARNEREDSPGRCH